MKKISKILIVLIILIIAGVVAGFFIWKNGESEKNNTNNIKLVNLSGDILKIHSYYYKKIRESIEYSKNPLVQFKNELITYAFLPLYIEIYTEKHLNILGS